MLVLVRVESFYSAGRSISSLGVRRVSERSVVLFTALETTALPLTAKVGFRRSSMKTLEQCFSN